jgi:hypothetical protein
VVALVAYAVVPLAYNALALGHWDGLLAYAAAPWVVAIIGRSSGEVPFPQAGISRAAYRIVALGLIVAVVGSVAPSYLYVVIWSGLALLAGSALAGRRGPGLRMLAVSAGGAVVAFVLLFPWSVSVLFGGTAVLGPDYGPAGQLGLGRVLRFDTGPFGGAWLGWALLVVAALPLLIGREWRLAWAARLWVMALGSFGLAWAGSRGWLPAFPTEVVLSMAAAGLAGSAALGVAAFEIDLPGYAFGWRQLAPPLAALALALSSGPLLAAAAGGRWDVPSSGPAAVLAFLPDNHNGDYRVLWVGAPDALPLSSRKLHPGVAYAASYNGVPRLPDLWLTGSPGAAPQLATDLRLVENRMTTKVGHLLATGAVRYIVVPNHNAPSNSGARAVSVPNALLAGLSLQTDLHLLDVGDPNYEVFVNSAWMAARAQLPDSAATVAATPGSAGLRPVEALDPSGATPVLVRGHGPPAPGSTLYVADTRSSGWRLTVGNRSIGSKPAFGWAMAFAVPAGSGAPARLAYGPPVWSQVGQVLDVLLWVGAAALVVHGFRSRRRAASAAEVADPAWFVPATPNGPAGPARPAVRRPGRRKPASTSSGGELTGEEVWSDI